MITEYQLAGLTCQHCVHAVTEEISAIGGVSQVDIDLPTQKMHVTSAEPLSFADVAAAVQAAGEGDYQVAAV